MAAALASAAAAPSAHACMHVWQQAALSLYWFATNTHWTAILITLLPLQAELIGGAEFKGTTLGQILAIGALASMTVAPLAAMSERMKAVFPVERKKTEQGHWRIVAQRNLLRSRL